MRRKEIQRPRAEENSLMTERMKMQALALKLQFHHSKINLLRSHQSGMAVRARSANMPIFKICIHQALQLNHSIIDNEIHHRVINERKIPFEGPT